MDTAIIIGLYQHHYITSHNHYVTILHAINHTVNIKGGYKK